MHSEFALAWECSTKGSVPASTSSASEPALWLSSNAKPTLRPASYPGWKRRVWSQRLFGQAISNPAMSAAFMDWWTSALLVSRAPLSARPEANGESMTSDGYCPPSWKCFARLEPDSSFSKMCQGSCQRMLDGSLEKFTGSWPRSGTMRNGSLYERPTWVPATSAIASSSWPSARAEDSESCGNHFGAADSLNAVAGSWPTPNANPAAPNNSKNRGKDYGGERERMTDQCLESRALQWPTPFGVTGNHGPDGNEFSTAVRAWATPRAEGSAGSSDVEWQPGKKPMRNGKSITTTLTDQANLWTTPQAHDVTQRGSGQKPTAKAGNACLAKDATTWPTPKTGEGGETGTRSKTDPKAGRQLHEEASLWATPNTPTGGPNTKSTAKHTGGLDLDGQASMWPTASARDHKGSLPMDQRDRTMGTLDEAAERRFSPPAPATHDGQTSSENVPGSPQPSRKKRLNPLFVCFLMGWPEFWTTPVPTPCELRAMESWRFRLRCHLSSLLGDC